MNEEQLTKEQAIALYESNFWETMSYEERAKFQMTQERRGYEQDAKLAPCSCGHKVEIKECERRSLDKNITAFCVYCPECLSYTEFIEGVTKDKVVYYWNNQHKAGA